jgi:serine/threonine-protein kinase
MSTLVGERRHAEGAKEAAVMTPSRWDRLTVLFASALDVPVSERVAFVRARAQDDAALGEEVLSLLASHDAEHALAVEARLLSLGDATSAHTVLETGTRLGSYEIRELVGEGGMGEVYRAQRVDGAYHQTVAIKVLRAGFLTAETLRRFRLEREVLARLVHPNIAAIYDAGSTPDGRPYLVLQFVDGTPITDYADLRALSVRERLTLFRRVADAVHFAHSRLVIHRDLKPSNILVEPHGDPKLLDFGVAKLLDDRHADSLAVATRPETRILTPEHAAPEQLRGEPVSTATDVYALGVLLCELLTGRRPFRGGGKTPIELEQAILRDDPPTASTLAPSSRARELRGDLDRIVAMALRKEPDRRYASANQLSEDVGRFLAGEPVLAERDTLRYRAVKFIGRNRTLVFAVVGSLLSLGTAAGVLTVQARRLTIERDRAEAERIAADDLLGIVTRLFDRANPMRVPRGDTVRVSELLREAERQVDSLAGDPRRQARLQRTLGAMYHGRGDYPAAIRQLSGAAATLRREQGEDSEEAALAYHELATARNLYDGSDDGVRMLDSSIAWLRRIPTIAPRVLADAIQQRAVASIDAAEQRRFLDEAVALRRAPGVDPIEIAAQMNAEAGATGVTAVQQLALLEGALRILTTLLPADHPNVRTVRGNVVSGLIATGQLARAESLARAIQRELPPNAPGGTDAIDEERLALLAAMQGRLEEAEVTMRRSLANLERRFAPRHWRRANSVRNLAVMVTARGRLREGLTLMDSAISLVDSSADGSYAGMAGQRGRMLVRLGRFHEARRALQFADSAIRDAYPAGHQYHGDVTQWMGELAFAEGDVVEAIATFERAVEHRRSRLPRTGPMVSESVCSLGAARRRLAESVAVTDSVARAACGRYAQWGMPSPLVLNWARQAGLL